jgi:methyltransferase (TIGR00027 family)
MRERSPSQTASLVALSRALAHDGLTRVPGFSDPYALAMLSPRWTLAHRVLAGSLHRAAPASRDRVIARFDSVPIRVAAIDREIAAAVAAGCRQLVILGAGLDTRAFRMKELASVAVFEIDHPATQAYKRRKSSLLRSLAPSLTFVPVDFERGSPVAGLGEAGFNAAQPTVWLWEGVVMYLTDEAMRRTLADVRQLSAFGSTLIVHYHAPLPTSVDPERIVRTMRTLLLTLWREPQIGRRTHETMREEVGRAGFHVVSDTRLSEWARRLDAEAPLGQMAALARLLVARRDSAAG